MNLLSCLQEWLKSVSVEFSELFGKSFVENFNLLFDGALLLHGLQEGRALTQQRVRVLREGFIV